MRRTARLNTSMTSLIPELLSPLPIVFGLAQAQCDLCPTRMALAVASRLSGRAGNQDMAPLNLTRPVWVPVLPPWCLGETHGVRSLMRTQGCRRHPSQARVSDETLERRCRFASAWLHEQGSNVVFVCYLLVQCPMWPSIPSACDGSTNPSKSARAAHRTCHTMTTKHVMNKAQ